MKIVYKLEDICGNSIRVWICDSAFTAVINCTIPDVLYELVV